jgi:hypothetical protein
LFLCLDWHYTWVGSGTGQESLVLFCTAFSLEIFLICVLVATAVPIELFNLELSPHFLHRPLVCGSGAAHMQALGHSPNVSHNGRNRILRTEQFKCSQFFQALSSNLSPMSDRSLGYM